jgi:transcriptional regulator with XRE-family HTH domain
MRQVKPITSKVQLAPTLARRVGQLRDLRNMTTKDLGRISRFGQQRIEDLEAGIETWLSVTDRQTLAKALVVEPSILQEVETQPGLFPSTNNMDNQRLHEAILNGARDLECPQCRSTLKCSIQEGLDIEGKPIRFAKAYCSQCPFVLY